MNIMDVENRKNVKDDKNSKSNLEGKVNEKYYIELTVRSKNTINPDCKAQRQVHVRCDSETIALKVVQYLRYAKSMHEEMTHTLSDQS